jgi:hypothetical protein
MRDSKIALAILQGRRRAQRALHAQPFAAPVNQFPDALPGVFDGIRICETFNHSIDCVGWVAA